MAKAGLSVFELLLRKMTMNEADQLLKY